MVIHSLLFIVFFKISLFTNLYRWTECTAAFINIDQFINLLIEKQRTTRLNEILYPLYDEKRAAEIIATYEQNEEAVKESKFIFYLFKFSRMYLFYFAIYKLSPMILGKFIGFTIFAL